jgi:predicted glycosyltransferase
MRILVEILHPAHVHVFKHAIFGWKARGDEVLVLSRDKECANALLSAYEIPFKSISTLGKKKGALLAEMVVRDIRMLRAALKFKPDILVGIMGVTIVQVGKLIRRPAVVFYDTENAVTTNRFVYPMAHSVCTPECYSAPVNGRHVTYPGYHELAYLHPNHFTPDADAVRALGIDPESPYFIVRFVSWQASHDVGETGLGAEFKRNVVKKLGKLGRVLITSEGALPDDLEAYRFALPPESMHNVMAFARILVGESATMASEAAVLGIPALYISDTGRGYTDEEQEMFQLVFNFKTSEGDSALACLDELLAMQDLGAVFQERRKTMLSSRIDTSEWMINYIDGLLGEIHP